MALVGEPDDLTLILGALLKPNVVAHMQPEFYFGTAGTSDPALKQGGRQELTFESCPLTYTDTQNIF